MSKLNVFTKSQLLSKEETASIFGGIRFITTSHSEYRDMRKQLMRSGTSFMEEVNHGDGNYCIEW